jgi:hypothetical protein
MRYREIVLRKDIAAEKQQVHIQNAGLEMSRRPSRFALEPPAKFEQLTRRTIRLTGHAEVEVAGLLPIHLDRFSLPNRTQTRAAQFDGKF